MLLLNMKFLTKLAAIVVPILLLPVLAEAAIATPWNATSTDKGYISPNLINGNSPWLVIGGLGTSTFAGPVQSPCFTLNGTTCLTFSGTGTVTQINTTFPILGGPITTTGTLTFGGLTTSTPAVVGNLPYFSGVNTFASVATTSVTCSGSTTCTSFTAIGGSPITISSSGGGTNYWSIVTGGIANNTGINVGIGTSTPSASLSVDSTTTTPTEPGLLISSQGTPYASVASSTVTHFGIGTTSTSFTLGVQGNELLSGDLKVANIVATGTETLSALATPAGSFLAVNGTGVIIATTTPAGGGGVSAVNGTYPIISSGGGTPAISIAFGTTTSNLWAGTQTFTNTPVFSTLTAGTVNATAGGTIYNTATSSVSSGTGVSFTGTAGALVGGTALTITNSSPLSGLTTSFPLSFSNPALSWIGLSTTSQPTAGQLLYSNGTNGLTPVSTTSLAVNASITSSGTLGAQVGGSATTLSLNMGNANSWTSLQTFANSSTTLASFTYASSTQYFGAGLTTCSGSSYLHWSSGLFSCGTPSGGGGSGNVATSSSETATQVAYWTSNSASPATLSGGSSNFTFDGTNVFGRSLSVNQFIIDNGGLDPYIDWRTSGHIIFTGRSAGTVDIDNSSNVAISGNLGVGTSSPYAKLAIGGNVVVGAPTAGGTLGDLFLPKLGTAAGSFLAVDATGKVIATTTPSGGGGAVSSVSNADGTLTISPTTGAVVASLALGHANVWTALQQFLGNASSSQESATQAYFGGTATTTITSNGFVGIGSSTPYGELGINAPAGTAPYFVIGSSTEVAKITANVLPTFGLGSSTPMAQFVVSVSAAIGAVFDQIIAGTHYLTFVLDSSGHLRSGGPVPTIATCTGGSVVGDDRNGIVTMTSGLTCSINFANAYPVQPVCFIDPETAATTIKSLTSTSQIALTFGTAQTSWGYHCEYHQ